MALPRYSLTALACVSRWSSVTIQTLAMPYMPAAAQLNVQFGTCGSGRHQGMQQGHATLSWPTRNAAFDGSPAP